MAFVIAFLISVLGVNLNYKLDQILFELRLSNKMKSNGR